MSDKTIPELHWEWDGDSDRLQAASSKFFDDESSLVYCIEQISYHWEAYFEGHLLLVGSLRQCLDACQKSEEDAE